jgi:hypothetical protein
MRPRMGFGPVGRSVPVFADRNQVSGEVSNVFLRMGRADVSYTCGLLRICGEAEFSIYKE